MQPCQTIVLCEYVLTQDDERTLIHDAALAIEDGRFAAVGTRETVLSEWLASRTVDLGASMVLPGLVNAHTHAPMTLLRGLADDMPLMQWLEKHVFPVEQHHTPESVREGALLACAEMLSTGCTCFADMHFFSRQCARAADEIGMRAVPGEAVFGFPTPAYADPFAALDAVRANHETFRDNPRIRPAIAPHAIYTTTPQMLTRSFGLAEELDTPWLFHLSETCHETETCLEQTGQRPAQYLDSLGLLTPRTSLAHCVDLNAEDIDLLARRGVCAVHCPESNMKLASGVAPVEKMLRAGLCVGLGTDGAASNNNLNLFGEMGTAALLHKAHNLDPTALPAQEALDLATRGSAQCVGWPELGRICVGGPADICALDLTVPWLQPCYNPVSHVVYAATGSEVRCTMVAGKVLYLDGAFPDFDYPGLLQQVEQRALWILEKV